MHLAGDVGREEHQVRSTLEQDDGQGVFDFLRRLEQRVGMVSGAQPVEVVHAIEVEAVRLRADDDDAGGREIDTLGDLSFELAAVPGARWHVGGSDLESEERADPEREADAPPS